MGTIYFSHDEDARNDAKIIKLRSKFGMEGYGCYFAILEMFSAETTHRMEYSQDQFDAIAYDLRFSGNVKDFIDMCIKFGLFQCDGEQFWSDSFDRRASETMRKAQAKSERAKKAAEGRWDSKSAEQPKESVEKPKAKEIQEPSENHEPFGIEGLDPDWIRFVKVYEQNIGMLPNGGSMTGQILEDYYNEFGADVMCKAIETTNVAQPSNPVKFLMAILKNWAEKGVTNLEQAEAATVEHNRGIEERKKQGNRQYRNPALNYEQRPFNEDDYKDLFIDLSKPVSEDDMASDTA